MSQPLIPTEIIVSEILARTPVDTVGRCRAVCQEWNKATQGIGFWKSHQSKNQNFWGYIAQVLGGHRHSVEFIPLEDNLNSPKLTLDFMPEPGIIMGADEGIVYYAPNSWCTQKSTVCYISKPSTKQWWVIPGPKAGNFSPFSALKVFRDNPLQFHILHFYYPGLGINGALHLEAFDSRTKIWTPGQSVLLSSHELLGFEPAIFVDDTFHWLTTEGRILTYRLSKDEWGELSIPREIRESLYGMNMMTLTKYRGRIAICWLNNNEALELQMYDNQEWSTKGMWKTKEMQCPFLADFHSIEVAVECDRLGVVIHNLREGSSKTFELKEGMGYPQIIRFKSDRVQITAWELDTSETRYEIGSTSERRSD